MLKFEGKFAVGDYIRAYDFEPIKGRGDSYVEGTVVEIIDDLKTLPYKAYKITLERDVFNGNEEKERIGAPIFVPMEIGDDYDHRVFSM